MNYAIIVAAGASLRMQGVNKAFVEILGRPALLWTLEPFETHPRIAEIVLVGKKEDQGKLRQLVKEARIKKVRAIVEGGFWRQDSVLNGLRRGRNLGWQNEDFVFIQDGARILITKKEIDSALAAVVNSPVVVVGVPTKDTIHRVNQKGFLVETPPREDLFIAQTPQVLRFDLALSAFEKAQKEGRIFTDDVSLVRYYYSQTQVKVALGSYENIKITTSEDVAVVENILRARRNDSKKEN